MRNSVGPFLLVVGLVACGSSKPAKDSSETNQAWSSETGAAAPTASSATSSTSSWTKYDDPAAGLQAEMPCAKPTVAVKPGAAGPMQYTTKELTCVVGASKYTLEYWTSMNMDMSQFQAANEANVKAMVQPVLMSWVDSPQKDGFQVTEKGPISSQPGWVAFEVRGSKGSDVRIDRHFLLLPRHISTKATGPTNDSAQHERFNGSVRIVEVGVSASSVPEGKEAGISDRVIDYGGGKFSVALPCTPTMKPEQTDQTPDGPMKSREWECHHPAANQGFLGSVGRLERASSSSMNAAAKKTKNTQLANENAQALCLMMKQTMPTAKCKASTAKPYGTNGAEASVESEGMNLRVIVDVPYMATIGVVAPVAVPEKSRILTSLKTPPSP